MNKEEDRPAGEFAQPDQEERERYEAENELKCSLNNLLYPFVPGTMTIKEFEAISCNAFYEIVEGFMVHADSL